MKIFALLVRLLLMLPDSVKLWMSGGKQKKIVGRTLNIDNQFLCANNSRGPQLDDMEPVKARRVFKLINNVVKGTMTKQVNFTDINIKLNNNEGSTITGRLYKPKNIQGISPLLIYFHGGGNVIGDLVSYDVACGYFSEQLNIRVLSVDYRLAPEHKFPSAAYDAFHAYCWARENSELLSINKENIILAGDSAGAYLSTVTCLQAMENNISLPKAQVLIYPMTDMRMQNESYNIFENRLVLTKKMMEYFIGHYLNNEEEKLNPLASPLLAPDNELAKMPLTILTLSGFDPLYDEGLAYYQKLNSLGVNIQLIEHLDLTHGYITMTGALKRGKEAHFEIIDAIKVILNN